MNDDNTTDQPWTPQEKEWLLELGLRPSVSDRARLIPLVVHFRKNGTIERALELGMSTVSKPLARKIQRLVGEGKLGWVVEARPHTESTIQPPREDHLRELANLAATLRDQLIPPDHFETVRGSGKTRREVFSEMVSGECAWYLGSDADGPELRIEGEPDFPYLKSHLKRGGVWNDLQPLRQGVYELVAARNAARSWLRDQAERQLGPTISRLDQEGGGITAAFTRTTYEWGIRTALGAQLPERKYYFIVKSDIPAARPGWQHKNHRLRFLRPDGETIAVYPIPPFPRDAWEGITSKFYQPHRELINTFAKGTATDLIARHRKLDEMAQAIRTRLAPVALMQLLASGRCEVCLDH